MSRKERGRRAALRAARLSQFYVHRVGAAIFHGNRLITLGFNIHKSHPKNDCFTLHAEFDSLRKVKKKDKAKLVMYIARLTRTDKISFSQPCPSCQNRIKEAGIKKVFFTGYSGELEELILEE